MAIQTIVSDVKGRVEPYVAKGQEVATLSFDTLKKAGDVVVDGAQSVFKTQVGAGQDLIAALQTSFEKAKSAGIKAVAASPIEYLPEGKATLVAAYNDTVSSVSKTSDEVVKIVKKGFDSVSAKLTPPSKAAKKVAAAKKTVRKTAKRVAKKVTEA